MTLLSLSLLSLRRNQLFAAVVSNFNSNCYFNSNMEYSKRRLLLLSASTPLGAGFAFLHYAKADIERFFNENNVTEVLFVPYASRDHDSYTDKVRRTLQHEWNFKVKGIHEDGDPVEAVRTAQAIFVGGGNTFLLLKTLYDKNLIETIRRRVLNDGIPYMGSSAGTNLATLNVCTTNDMPIVHPPTFDALALLPFNINPHYSTPDVNNKQPGETRDERILEFLEAPGNGPVLALWEGATLHVQGYTATLKGIAGAKVFSRDDGIKEFKTGDDLSYLLKS